MCARRSDTLNKKMQIKRQTQHVHKCIKCSKYPCICCDKFFVLNLAGLKDNLNYELLRYKGQKAEIETVFGTMERGVLCNFGIDFIDIKEQDGAIVTILKDKISKIYLFADKNNDTFC